MQRDGEVVRGRDAGLCYRCVKRIYRAGASVRFHHPMLHCHVVFVARLRTSEWVDESASVADVPMCEHVIDID